MTASRLDSITGANFLADKALESAYSDLSADRQSKIVLDRGNAVAVRDREITKETRGKDALATASALGPRRKARPYTDKKSPPEKCSSVLRR